MSSKSWRSIYSNFLSLTLLLKESRIKTSISDMYKESKEIGRVNSSSYKMCVSIKQHFLRPCIATLSLWDQVQSCFCILRDLHPCFRLPQTLVMLPIFSVVHPDIFHLSGQDASCSDFRISLLCSVPEEPTQTPVVVSSYITQSVSYVPQAT